ncbi:hypothetical protein [Methylobacterium ajmalii]|uniref:hypothetical protein n=1 Tax=Methylobacterium ajmalii TaxID=2738439 RepID=UPI00190D2BAB|nr:hypothetical protein [Methylobacterium ajmalii]MBK3397689.1 hypothetical protein [Methylobacterium ajmalii]MBK3411706.1 hypothetical protein [Methylobacterium ajmalii]MBK3425435.1 hypothetical protein [Methylobacterium ajmalii]MBZ6414805.1 hypothetical protein [Methylobacterium sp.]
MSEYGLRRERYPVGDYVWEHVTEAERECLREFTALTAEEHRYDPVYCALGNAGIGSPMEEDEPVEDWHVKNILERMAYARLLDVPTDEGEWRHILSLATDSDEGAARLARLFEEASGIDDEEAFDEDERSDFIAEWARQCGRLRALERLGSFEEPPAPARPSLVRWAAEGGEIPAVDNGGEQLDLGVDGK